MPARTLARRRRAERQVVVVVGAGRAGVAAVEELRRQGYSGDVVVLHDEEVGPYDRPACSKGLLTGHKRPRDAVLRMRGVDGVEWRLGRRAAALDPDAHVVVTDAGEPLSYDGLVIATGATPRIPPDWPVGEPGLHALYRLGDAWRLREELRRARRVAVVGAGLTWCELAHAVRSLALECVLVDPQPVALARPLGEQVGQMVTREIARDGVQLRLGRRVTSLARARRGWTLGLDDGEQVDADLVVSTIGDRPDTGWLEGTPGLDLSDGILCDPSLRVVGASDVVAAGTVARWPNLRYSAVPSRVGQWITAMEQGRAAARALLAGDRSAEPFMHVPRFWSEQFGLRIQVCGILPAEAEITLTEQRRCRRGRSTLRAGVAVEYRVEGQLVGLVAVNAPRAFTSITRAMLASAAPQTAPSHDAPQPVTWLSPRPADLSTGLPVPAGPPPISGPLPLRPPLYALN
jgi:NADPH-dependent 2,4-dienoyl-CoA reductase/sulfur reductase-like enzyme